MSDTNNGFISQYRHIIWIYEYKSKYTSQYSSFLEFYSTQTNISSLFEQKAEENRGIERQKSGGFLYQ